jgi:hypothetical protein
MRRNGIKTLEKDDRKTQNDMSFVKPGNFLFSFHEDIQSLKLIQIIKAATSCYSLLSKQINSVKFIEA